MAQFHIPGIPQGVYMNKKSAQAKLNRITNNMVARAIAIHNEWHSIRSMLGHTWAIFYVILGAREAGKSYAVMKYFISQWKKKKQPFYWLRLNEASTQKLLKNNAEKFVDADIRRQFDLDLTVKGTNVYDHGEKMAEILALSTYYNDKGVGYFDNEWNLGYNICLDEFQLEKDQKRQGDVCYQFVNQMENLVRSTKEKLSKLFKGENHPLYGKHHSAEVRRKISLTKSFPVLQFSKDNKFLAEYESAKTASKLLGICYQNISLCCKKNKGTAGGYIWKYKN